MGGLDFRIKNQAPIRATVNDHLMIHNHYLDQIKIPRLLIDETNDRLLRNRKEVEEDDKATSA